MGVILFLTFLIGIPPLSGAIALYGALAFLTKKHRH